MRRAALLGALMAIAAAVPARGYPPITCGRSTVMGKTLVVRTHGPTCTFAKRGVKDYLLRKRAPKGWTCKAYGDALPAHCSERRHPRSRYFDATPA
jgi:hypothetical protein